MSEQQDHHERCEQTSQPRPTLLHFVYENTHSAAGGTQRAKDLAEIAEEQQIKGFKVDRMRLQRSGGYNINVTMDDPRFNSHFAAMEFLRPCCMKKRKDRRDIKEAKENKRKENAES